MPGHIVGFQNSYPSKVWVAIMYYSPASCRELGDWRTEGWWGLDPGTGAWVVDTSNRYLAFYAEADDGVVWNGPYGPVRLYWNAFSACWLTLQSPVYETVGMRGVDLGPSAWNPFFYIVNLVP